VLRTGPYAGFRGAGRACLREARRPPAWAGSTGARPRAWASPGGSPRSPPRRHRPSQPPGQTSEHHLPRWHRRPSTCAFGWGRGRERERHGWAETKGRVHFDPGCVDVRAPDWAVLTASVPPTAVRCPSTGLPVASARPSAPIKRRESRDLPRPRHAGGVRAASTWRCHVSARCTNSSGSGIRGGCRKRTAPPSLPWRVIW
jgi:hypothetical protein